MKYMAIGDVRPREVREEHDEDSTRVIPPTSVQNEDQPSASGSQNHQDKCKIKRQVLVQPKWLNQVEVVKCKVYNQLCIKLLQGITHWIN